MKSVRLAYSITEACEVSSVGRTTLYAAIKRGDLQSRKVGRRTLVTAKELLAWLESRPVVKVGAPAAMTRVAADIASNGEQS